MKVVSISRLLLPGDILLFKPSHHFSRARLMPCDLVECYDAESVREHGPEADVIIMPGAASAWPSFWNEIADFIDNLECFKVFFSIDSYRSIWPLGQKEIAFSAIVPLMLTAYLANAGNLRYKCGQVFWSPSCLDVPAADPERDIDVLVWGNTGHRHYPFRNFIVRSLAAESYCERVEGELIRSLLHLGSSDYEYVRVPYQNVAYWGHGLYDVILRSRICCQGSSFMRGPVPRYFENAACGCVSLTNDFTDRARLGFEHGRNIWITDESRFMDDLDFLLLNPELVEEMGKNAKDLIQQRHTVEIRARELYSFLSDAVGCRQVRE